MQEKSDQRDGIIFLEHFVEAISQPVAKDGREHVSYAPSQVMSEFFALVFKNDDVTRLDGIEYPSAVHSGGTNFVLFPSTRSFKRKFEMVRFERSETKHIAANAS